MKSNRIIWADIVRVAAIYLVLVVHNTKLETPVNTAGILNIISFIIAKPVFLFL
jgi:hypothetical protein